MAPSETNMIAAVVIFLIIAGCVTWYVTSH